MSKNKEDHFSELKEKLLEAFIDSSYMESDRIHVEMNQIVDEWASYMSFEEVLDFLGQFDPSDYSTLDSGLYDGVLEKDGFEKLCVVLAYCLMEQELLNDNVINDLQNWEKETEEGKQLMKRAEEEFKQTKGGRVE